MIGCSLPQYEVHLHIHEAFEERHTPFVHIVTLLKTSIDVRRASSKHLPITLQLASLALAVSCDQCSLIIEFELT